MNGSAEVTLRALRAELRAIEAEWRGGYVLFGSAVMLLHGLRETIGDVDLFVRVEVWAALWRRGWLQRTPHPLDPPLLEAHPPGGLVVHAFERWRSGDPWVDPARCFRERETVAGWPCAPLEVVREQKAGSVALWGADHPANAKHVRDLELLDEVLA